MMPLSEASCIRRKIFNYSPECWAAPFSAVAYSPNGLKVASRKPLFSWVHKTCSVGRAVFSETLWCPTLITKCSGPERLKRMHHNTYMRLFWEHHEAEMQHLVGMRERLDNMREGLDRLEKRVV